MGEWNLDRVRRDGMDPSDRVESLSARSPQNISRQTENPLGVNGIDPARQGITICPIARFQQEELQVVAKNQNHYNKEGLSHEKQFVGDYIELHF